MKLFVPSRSPLRSVSAGCSTTQHICVAETYCAQQKEEMNVMHCTQTHTYESMNNNRMKRQELNKPNWIMYPFAYQQRIQIFVAVYSCNTRIICYPCAVVVGGRILLWNGPNVAVVSSHSTSSSSSSSIGGIHYHYPRDVLSDCYSSSCIVHNTIWTELCIVFTKVTGLCLLR